MEFLSPQFISLPGLVPYEEARELQHRLVNDRATGRIGDTVLFLEHPPVITRGRGLQRKPGEERAPMAVPSPESLAKLGVQFAESERGGDLTYHGPGQLVVYPIFKLDGESGFSRERDIDDFLRSLERVLINVLAEAGVLGESRPDATGVWAGDRKIASIGIAIRKWVTYHGMAINLTNDLRAFHLISPCGFSPEVMTRWVDIVGSTVEPGGLRRWMEERLKFYFSRASLPELAHRATSLARSEPAAFSLIK